MVYRMRKRALNERQVALAFGLDRSRGSRQCIRVILIRQRVQSTIRAQPIHMPLRQHRSQPRRQAAASVEVAKERLPYALTVSEPEQIRVQRIREVARPAAGLERISSAVKMRALLEDEML